jgi:hypothetical protein
LEPMAESMARGPNISANADERRAAAHRVIG